MSDPVLIKASELDEHDLGTLTWDDTHNASVLTVSDEGRCVAWGPRKETNQSKHYPPAWVPIRSKAQLHSGVFTWDFLVDELAEGQIGVGFMLRWDRGLDWGFYGYLGAGSSAWAYDPSTGDVVNETRSIAGGLPSFADVGRGTVSVRLELPRERSGLGTFIVNRVSSPPVQLPAGAVVVPAACLLREGQRVRLSMLVRAELAGSERGWLQKLFGR